MDQTAFTHKPDGTPRHASVAGVLKHFRYAQYSLSRLARSTKDAIEISERLHHAGADLVSVSEKIDTTSPAGKMVFRMLAVLAEFERDILVERTKTALDHLRSKGMRISGRIPFGFDLAGDGETLKRNATEQATLARIRSERVAGKSLRAIADGLNADGAKTKQGGKWGASSIQAVLATDGRRNRE